MSSFYRSGVNFDGTSNVIKNGILVIRTGSGDVGESVGDVALSGAKATQKKKSVINNGIKNTPPQVLNNPSYAIGIAGEEFFGAKGKFYINGIELGDEIAPSIERCIVHWDTITAEFDEDITNIPIENFSLEIVFGEAVIPVYPRYKNNEMRWVTFYPVDFLDMYYETEPATSPTTITPFIEEGDPLEKVSRNGNEYMPVIEFSPPVDNLLGISFPGGVSPYNDIAPEINVYGYLYKEYKFIYNQDTLSFDPFVKDYRKPNPTFEAATYKTLGGTKFVFQRFWSTSDAGGKEYGHNFHPISLTVSPFDYTVDQFTTGAFAFRSNIMDGDVVQSGSSGGSGGFLFGWGPNTNYPAGLGDYQIGLPKRYWGDTSLSNPYNYAAGSFQVVKCGNLIFLVDEVGRVHDNSFELVFDVDIQPSSGFALEILINNSLVSSFFVFDRYSAPADPPFSQNLIATELDRATWIETTHKTYYIDNRLNQMGRASLYSHLNNPLTSIYGIRTNVEVPVRFLKSAASFKLDIKVRPIFRNVPLNSTDSAATGYFPTGAPITGKTKNVKIYNIRMRKNFTLYPLMDLEPPTPVAIPTQHFTGSTGLNLEVVDHVTFNNVGIIEP